MSFPWKFLRLVFWRFAVRLRRRMLVRSLLLCSFARSIFRCRDDILKGTFLVLCHSRPLLCIAREIQDRGCSFRLTSRFCIVRIIRLERWLAVGFAALLQGV